MSRRPLLTEDVEELKNELSKLQVGDRFTYGNYHGEIEWRVLEKDSESLLVVSEFALDTKLFDEEGKTNDWNTCSLKKWLNSEFFDKAFDSENKSLIENTSYGKVFLLSIDEAKKYFLSDSDRKCRPTQYAKSQKAYITNGFTWWWLRSYGHFSNSVAYVFANGFIDFINVNCPSGSVRPAMRLKI